MGRGLLARSGSDQGEQRRRGCGRRFSPLDAATTAREGSGDGLGHRLDCAVSDLDFTGVETAGIEGKYFGRFGENRGNPRFKGFPGWRGSRAAGERCPNFFFLGWRFTGSRSMLPGPARFA
ncbi:hypothetical protein CRG98_019101 [Punica granatum]|uniref:Uncharacterized protein n=1 Tax=Punica granatum TaxID=22663 RepID=A0A2I0JVV8_PUNGR|nr:hypothetical protein CRG98_019101 [Punica granatum]